MAIASTSTAIASATPTSLVVDAQPGAGLGRDDVADDVDRVGQHGDPLAERRADTVDDRAEGYDDGRPDTHDGTYDEGRRETYEEGYDEGRSDARDERDPTAPRDRQI